MQVKFVDNNQNILIGLSNGIENINKITKKRHFKREILLTVNSDVYIHILEKIFLSNFDQWFGNQKHVLFQDYSAVSNSPNQLRNFYKK